MRAAARKPGGYKPSYKKKTITTDPYKARGGSAVSVCGSCRAVYRNKRWYADEKTGVTAAVARGVELTVCPACLKIRDDFPGGIVTLKGGYVLAHKQEIMHLVRNEEERARGFNPLERIMAFKENGYGSLVITTTNEKLAQRLGRALKKAFHGDVSYRWSHDDKLVRVEWLRDEG